MMAPSMMAPSSACGYRRRLLLALLCLALVHGAGLYLFTLGFFLTRFEVSDVSSCQPSPSSGRHVSRLRQHEDVAMSAATGGCWMPQRFRRVIFVVIDALRFDFVHAPASSAAGSSSFYLHHLPILNATLHARPAHSALFKFVADPPTMTMQRLKGLTTGSLPTFLDIKDNMASDSAITEDNLLRQMHAAKRPIVFMGDDTWQSLYASLFTRAYAFDSFNVKDLHSVDRGVERHLFPELQQDDWGLLIAHFLGVDHVGHTHGPSSPFMTEKLREMNAVLSRVLTEMPQEDTLLAVLGDHGMSADGNHGGASDEETGAALFLYSPTTKLLNEDAAQPEGSSWTNEVPQVDLVPTLSLLTGLPIPFGSLGAVIPQLFFHPQEQTARDENLAALANLNDALRLNVEQVRRYLFTYSSASKLPESEYDQLELIYKRIERLDGDLNRLDASEGDATAERGVREELAATQHAYVREALTLGRSIWTQFDLVSMSWGVIVLCLGLGMSVHGLGGPFLRESTLSKSTVLLAVGGGIIGRVVPHLGVLPRAPVSRGVLFASLTLVVRYFLSLEAPSHRQQATGKRLLNAPSLVAALVVLLHVLALLSNSYIVAELQVLNFLSATVGFFALIQSQRRRSPSSTQRHVISAVSFIVANRVLRSVERPNIIQSEASLLRTWLPLVALFVITSLNYSKTGRQTGRTRAVVATLSIAWSTAACAMYWFFTPIETTALRLWLPRSVYLLLLLSLVEGYRHQRSTLIPTTPQLTLSLCLVLGPTSPLVVLLCCVMWLSLAPSVEASESKQPWVLFLCIVAAQSFFLTGHECTFTSLQNAAGFVGFDTFHFYAAGALLGLNTFGSIALGLFHMPSLVGASVTSFRTPLTIVSYFSLQTLVSTVFVALQRRHLMVWAIFAPKYLFDGVTLLVIDLVMWLVVLQMDTPVETDIHQ